MIIPYICLKHNGNTNQWHFVMLIVQDNYQCLKMKIFLVDLWPGIWETLVYLGTQVIIFIVFILHHCFSLFDIGVKSSGVNWSLIPISKRKRKMKIIIVMFWELVLGKLLIICTCITKDVFIWILIEKEILKINCKKYNNKLI